MAWIRKIERSPYWQLEWRDGENKVCRRSTGSPDKRVAEKILAQFERDSALKKFGVKAEEGFPSIAQAIGEYQRQKEGLVKNKTRKMDEQALRQFMLWLGPEADALKICDVTEKLLADYRRDRRHLNRKNPLKPLSDTTMAIEARHQRSFFNWCKARGWIENLTVKIPAILHEAERVEYLSLGDARKLLSSALEYDIRIVYPAHLEAAAKMKELMEFLMLTGARVGESVKITWGQIDWEKRKIKIRGRNTKSGKRREIEISESLMALLRQIRKRRGPEAKETRIWPWGADWANRKFKRLARRAGLDAGLSIHCLRHTAASWLLASGATLKDTSEILGHSSEAVTEKHYAHLVPGHRARQMDNSPLAEVVRDQLK